MSEVKISFTWPPSIPPSQMFGSNLEGDLTRLIKKAKNEIILMAYNIGTSSQLFLQAAILNKLQNKPKLKIKLYCDTLTDATNFSSLYHDWKRNIEIKHWTIDNDNYSKFHIKSIIVDQQHIYIGSANLSYTAMTHSAECGIFLTDTKFYESIQQYVDVLEEYGKLRIYQ